MSDLFIGEVHGSFPACILSRLFQQSFFHNVALHSCILCPSVSDHRSAYNTKGDLSCSIIPNLTNCHIRISACPFMHCCLVIEFPGKIFSFYDVDRSYLLTCGCIVFFRSELEVSKPEGAAASKVDNENSATEKTEPATA